MQSQNYQYNYRIDELRGIACLMVFISHSYFYINFIKFFYLYFNRMGQIGVGIFFAISGYLFSNILLYNNKINYFNFYWNRFLRIIPIFIIFTIFSCFISPSLFSSKLILSIISLQWYGNYNGIFANSWSLAIELIFYIFLPALIFLLKKRKKLFLMIFIINIILYLILNNYSFYNYYNYFSFIGNIPIFLFSMVLSVYNIPNIFKYKIVKNIIFILTPILMIPFFYNSDNKYLINISNIFLFIICPMIVISYISYKRENSFFHKILLFFGKISLSFYLSHPIVFHFTKKYITENLLLSILIAFILTIIISTITYNLVEKPFMSLRKKY